MQKFPDSIFIRM